MTEIISPAKPWYFTTSTLIILINTASHKIYKTHFNKAPAMNHQYSNYQNRKSHYTKEGGGEL